MGIRKILTFVKLKIASKIFRKIKYGCPCDFEKTHVALARLNRYKFYSAAYNVFLEI